MAMLATDNQLLRAYARARDERAFAELVGRHADWITRAARRRLGDGHAADDAAQAVFLLLSRDAARLASSPDRKSLSTWLFHAMHLFLRPHRPVTRPPQTPRAPRRRRAYHDD